MTGRQSRTEAAAALGVSRRTLRRWRQRGAPGFADDAAAVVDLEALRAWRDAIRPRSAIESDPELLHWTREFQKAKALLAVLDVKERQGQLIAIDEHKRKMVSFAADFRSQLLQLPKRMCHLLHGLDPDEIRERLESECERLLDAVGAGGARLSRPRRTRGILEDMRPTRDV